MYNKPRVGRVDVICCKKKNMGRRVKKIIGVSQKKITFSLSNAVVYFCICMYIIILKTQIPIKFRLCDRCIICHGIKFKLQTA